MAQDLLKAGNGRFFRGNLHCHSNRSDGVLEPAEVAGAYREAGYDFICLSDHFEAEYGWRVTDTRSLRDGGFTTIAGAELSSGPWAERNTYWVVAAGASPWTSRRLRWRTRRGYRAGQGRRAHPTALTVATCWTACWRRATGYWLMQATTRTSAIPLTDSGAGSRFTASGSTRRRWWAR